ncbi:MAG: YARHG domain-containing protein [Bacillota bacterium]|nr:YARHG domain-containing protein [Bacillota bacterium]
MKKFLILIFTIAVLSGCSKSAKNEELQANTPQTTMPAIVEVTEQKTDMNIPILTINSKDYDLSSEFNISSTDKLSKEDLGYLRNGIYAKYGYKFKSKIYSEYFSRFDWYEPSKDNVDELLNEVDKKNIQLILNMEKGSKGNEQVESGKTFELTKQDIANFEKKLSESGNWSFLTCEYSEPSEIDPNEVFYTGGGLSANISEAEKKDLLKNYGFSEEDFDLDYIRIETTDINNLLQEKVGLTLRSIKKKLTYKYVSKYDAYYNFHGDTNYIDLKCVSGNHTSAGLYVINYIANSHSSNPTNRKVTFRIVDNRIVFISNVKVN